YLRIRQFEVLIIEGCAGDPLTCALVLPQPRGLPARPPLLPADSPYLLQQLLILGPLYKDTGGIRTVGAEASSTKYKYFVLRNSVRRRCMLFSSFFHR